jgi:hypothetical protein
MHRRDPAVRVLWLFIALSSAAGACSSDSGGKTDGGDAGGTDAGSDRGGADGSVAETAPGDAAGDGGDGDTAADTGLDAAGDVGGRDSAVDAGRDAVTDVPPPTMLTATVVDRRQTTFRLTWPAPSNNGASVAGYQVRYAKVPITEANFNDTAVTTAVTYTGTPAAPGAADGLTIRLYIENAYYFAVSGTDAGGTRVGAFMTTAAAVAAHFNVTLLPSPTGTNQLFGSVVDGSADINGDGLSDLLVASANSGLAYLFFGSAAFAAGAPSVTFSSTSLSFGGNIRAIGDIDRDGMQDVAISDLTGIRVLIYKGRTNWPMTLADTQADYTITTDANWASSGFGFSMAALGDFNGDGSDDFVVGAPSFNTRVGRAVVIYGQTGFTSFALPSTARSLEIGGDAALDRTQFGLAVVGLGHFYAVTIGTTLVVSAPGLGDATSTSANEGRLYAIHGRGPGAAIDATAADHTKIGPGKAAKIGQSLSNLGPAVNALAAVGAGNPGDTLSVPGTTGSAFVLSGAAATGPLATQATLNQQGASGVGQVIFGGGFSGRDGIVSLIGDSKPDVGTIGQTATSVAIIDGVRIPGLTSPFNAQVSADVHVPLPTGWTGTAAGAGNLVRDINGDGSADFVLGDVLGVVPGRVAVFW